MKKKFKLGVLGVLLFNILSTNVLADTTTNNNSTETTPQSSSINTELSNSSKENEITSEISKTQQQTTNNTESEKESVTSNTHTEGKQKNSIRADEINKFVTITNKDTVIWLNEVGSGNSKPSSELYMKTFLAKESQTIDNKEYYSLYSEDSNNKEILIGYIDVDSLTIAEDQQGIYQNYQKFVTITNPNYQTYRNFSWSTLTNTKAIQGQTFHAKGKYEHYNGSTYLSIWDEKGTWFGYINENATSLGEGRQGSAQSHGKYVTVSSKNYGTYSDFNWTALDSTEKLYNKTYLAKEKYNHFNGSTYLSLFDNNGTWFGYVNKNATKEGNGAQGAYQNYNKYVTITNANYSTYHNFSWSQKMTSQKIYGKTLLAKGKYNHFNGLTYLSLFDDKGTWYGYINENATKKSDGRQGIYQEYNKYVTITNDSYTTYRNFSWTPLTNTQKLYGKTLHAKGKYEHFNGSTYLSLFDNKGAWYGYVNSNATKLGDGPQGVFQNLNRHILIKNTNYDMYNNFKWNVRQSAAKFKGVGLIAKGQYVHYNGSTYYSVYDGNNNWQGYINADATQIINYYETPTTYYSQMSIGAWYGCAATSMYTALRAKGYASNTSLVTVINELPLSDNNPDVGQIGDPWGRTPFKQVISPVGLTKYAGRYTQNAAVITGSSMDKMITEITSGNIVLFWGSIRMENVGIWMNPQHVIIAKGYKVVNGKEYILIQDPGTFSSDDRYAFQWYERNALDSYLNTKYRKMMVVR